MAIKFLSGLNLSNVTAGSILKLDSNGNIVAATAGTDYVASSTWSTASNSNIYYNSGGVRIGTYQSSVDAAAQLHVFDYQTTTPKFLIEDGNTGDASMQFKISTQQYTMGIDNSDSDKFVIAASSALGTTNALEIGTGGKLTVPAAASNGAVRLEIGGYNRLRFNGGIDLLGYTSDHLWVIGNTTTTTINIGADWDWDKQVAISYTPNTVGNYGGVLSIGQTEKNNTDWTHGVTRFYTSGGEKMRIDSAGNVGIGTTAPSEKLHVVGNGVFHSGANLGRIKVGRSANQEIEIYVDDTNNIITAYQDSDGNSSHVFALDREFDGTGANYFEIRKGGSAQMHIDTSGNVGIGTTSPGAKLDVRTDAPSTSGSIIYVRNTLADGTNNTFGGISFFSSPGTDYTIGKLNTGSASALAFRNANNGTEYMRITSAGNVGIGTTSANGKVTVFDDMISSSSTTTDIGISKTSYGSINFQGANQEAGATNTKQQAITWQVNDYGSTNIDYGVQAAIAVSNNGSVGTQMGFFTSNSYSGGPSERIRITAAGNVGIGNSNPSQKLDVSGTFRATGNITASSDIVSNGGGILAFIAGSNHVSGFTVYNAAQNGYLSNRITTDAHSRGWGWEFTTSTANASSGNVFFRVGYNGAVSYLNSGNFGIGTTNPGSLLSIRATTASHQLVRINRPNSDTAALYLGNNSSNDAIISGNNAPISLGKDVSGTYTEYVNIATDGELKFSAYGAGILKTNASGIVSLDTNTYLTSVSVDWSDIGSINGIININSTTQIGQGDTETLVSFQNSGTERGRFEVDDSANSYFVATGFKTTGSSTGLLKSDGTIDTSTYATTADINSFIEITDVATYLSTNNYITSSYTGFDSRYYTETEAEARFVSYENYNRAVPAAGGWYKLVKLSRGAVRIGISYTGGNMSPHTYIVEAFKDWSSTGTLNVQKYGESSYISEFRIIQESGGGNGDYYLEAYFTSLTNTHSFECYFQEILGYRSVSEIFAVSSGNTLNATNSGTNTPIEALVVGSNEGLYTRNLDVNGRLYLDTLDTNTTSTSALVLGSSSEIEKRTLGSAAFNANTDFVSVSGDTMTGTLKLDSELQFSRGGSGDYSNYIRATNYPSEGYTSASGKYWLEYGAKGGHHFVVNTDGGTGASENNYDDFTIWQGAVDGDRLFEVTNAGVVQIPNQLKIGGDTSSSSHYIYDAYHDANSAYFHAPKFLIRSDSSATGGIDEAPVALAMFNRNGTNNTWVKMAFASREVNGAGNTVSIAGIAAQKTTGTSGNWASGKLHLWTKNGATVVDNMVLQPNGNVGVGTSSPGYKLDVAGTIRSGTSYRTSINGDSSGAVVLFGSAADNDSLGIVGAYASLFNISSGNGDISFQFNNTERMRLNSTGNLGIGTTSPGGRLELNGSGQSWTTAPAIRMWDSYNSKGWLVGSANNVTAGDFYIRTLPGEDTNPGSSNQEFTIKHATGNVGIGTTSPETGLHYHGAVDGEHLMLISNTKTYGTGTGTNETAALGFAIKESSTTSLARLFGKIIASTNAETDSSDGTLMFQVRNSASLSTAMTIKNTGSVGIGTTSPSSAFKLDVNGYIKANSRVYVRDSTKTVEIGTDYIQSYVTSGIAVNPIRFFTGTTEKARVDGNGNFGIGTTSPGFKLEVNGTTRLGATATDYTRFGTYGALLSTDTHILHNMLWTGSWTQIDNTKSSSTIYMGSSSSNTIKFGYTGVGDTSWSYNHTFENDGDYTAAGVIKGYNSIRVDAAATGSPYFGLYQAGSEKAYIQYVDGTTDNLVVQSDGKVSIRGDVQYGQGEEYGVISFLQSNAELAKIDQAGYLYATGFKTTTASTGFLKADGSVDTSTYASSTHNHDSSYVLSTGGYYDEDFTWDGTHDFSNVIKVSGAAATTTNTTALFYGTNGVIEKRDLGSAAFSDSTDFAAASHTHSYLPLAGGTLTGDLLIDTGTTGSTTQAYSAFDSLQFNNQYSSVAAGPNKIVMYDDGGNWVGGFGIHDDTTAYYSGGTHKWYKTASGPGGPTFTQKMSLDASGNLAVTGTLSASGYNNSNWNTAYTYSQVGHLPLAGGALTGALTGTRAGFNSGASYPLTTSTSQRYSMQIRNTANTVNANYGWWWFMDTNFNMGFHADGAADRFTLTRDGALTISDDFSSARVSVTGSLSEEAAIHINNGRLRIGHHNSGSGVWFDTSSANQYWFAGLSGNVFRLWRSGNRFEINENGIVTLNNYGAGILKTNASGVVSVDTSTYLTSSTNISVRNITARDIVSESDRTYNLGTDANRWAVVFCETLDSAGQHESKLQNPEGETPISEYETGTVLVWKGGKNVPCTTAADHMRMGIAVKGIESPLVQGAEPVLCTGEVKEGDYLVTSTTEGHAEAISPEFMRQHMLFDCVIGKALEGGAGESHLVKTWINI